METKSHKNMSLAEMLQYLDEGGRMDPGSMGWVIKRVDPDFRIGGTPPKKRGKSSEDEWEGNRKWREMKIETMRNTIRNTPDPSERFLKCLGLTLEQYQEKRKLLFPKQEEK